MRGIRGVALVCFMVAMVVAPLCIKAQTRAEIKQAQKLFAGAWVNRKDKRHLTVSIENDGRININDWTVSPSPSSIDAYKAFIKQGKLIMPSESEHYAPYSELVKQGKYLVYLVKYPPENGKPRWDRSYFVREKW